MGFTTKRKVYVLDFAGLEVRARSTTLGRMLDMGDMVDAAGDDLDVDALAAMPAAAQKKLVGERMAGMRRIIDDFAAVLVSWNLEDDDGRPIPATTEGLRTLDPGELMTIIRTWQRVVADAPAPLPGPSSSGAPSLEGSLPMEALSPSLAS